MGEISPGSPEEPSQVSVESKEEVLPEHLVDLFDRSVEFLDEGQQTKVKSFLCEFQDVFAVGDHDLGRTGLV